MTDLTIETIQQKIAELIRDSFLYEIGQDGIEPDTNLFEAGVMDSYSLVELASFMEASFPMELDDSEMISPELTSYDGIVAFIARKSGVSETDDQ